MRVASWGGGVNSTAMFVLPGLEVLMTWEELRQMWPAYLERELLKSLDD